MGDLASGAGMGCSGCRRGGLAALPTVPAAAHYTWRRDNVLHRRDSLRVSRIRSWPARAREHTAGARRAHACRRHPGGGGSRAARATTITPLAVARTIDLRRCAGALVCICLALFRSATAGDAGGKAAAGTDGGQSKLLGRVCCASTRLLVRSALSHALRACGYWSCLYTDVRATLADAAGVERIVCRRVHCV